MDNWKCLSLVLPTASSTKPFKLLTLKHEVVMFSAELKEKTKDVHAALEKKLVARIKKINSAKDYSDLLCLMYGYYFPLQERLKPFIKSEFGSVPERGRQAAEILSDIHYLTGSIPTPALSSWMPHIDSFPSSLGALYVLEGSTLGGQIIMKMIAKQLGITTDHGFSFFNAYGEDTMKMWEDFKKILDRPFSETEQSKITAAATATFSTFKTWIQSHESATDQ